MRIALTGLIFISWLSTMAQTGAPQQQLSAADNRNVEVLVRDLEVVEPGAEVIVGTPKDSPLAEYYNIVVEVRSGNTKDSFHYLLSHDGKYLIKGSVFGTSRPPFQADWAKAQTPAQPSIGNNAAPVKVVLFGDLTSLSSKIIVVFLRKKIEETYSGKVQLIFRDYPDESDDSPSRAAALAGRCVFLQSPAAFWKFQDWIYTHLDEVTSANLSGKMLEFFKVLGLDGKVMSACLQTKATEADVDRSVAEALSMFANCKPIIVINGRPLCSDQLDLIEKVIQHNVAEVGRNRGPCGRVATSCELW